MLDINSSRDLLLIIRSQIPIVVIESHEEDELLAIVRILSRKLGRPSFCWTVTDGLVHQDNHTIQAAGPKHSKPEEVLIEIKNRQTPGIYVLTDFHPFLDDNPRVVRLLKEIALNYKNLAHTLILLSHQLDLPEGLKPFCAHFDMPVPDEKELKRIVTEECRQWSRTYNKNIKVNRDALEKLIHNLKGLTKTDARRLSRKAIYDDGVISESDIPEINAAKYKLLDMDGLLSFEYETAHFADVGALSNLKSWLESRKAAFLQKNIDRQTDIPKGIVLVGVQGAGKSLAAKAVAGAWGLPLLRLDFAILYNKFFGETERNLRKGLKMAEVMSPCVLWIDEIEKGLAAGDYDSGTSRRVLGTFLTWMAERKKPVFIVATSNDITNLPPELIRKGRIDEIFFVDLPEHDSRKEIFRIHFKKRDLPPEKYDLQTLADASRGFTGAEIEQAIVSALYRTRAGHQAATTGDIIEEIRKTSPLSVVMAEQIASLRKWAESRCVQAN